jgi:hypothetical protein
MTAHLRLLDAKVPSIYGPSADDKQFRDRRTTVIISSTTAEAVRVTMRTWVPPPHGGCPS